MMALGSMLSDDGVLSAAQKKPVRTEGVNPLSAKQPHFNPKAKACIFIFMAGAPSHVDLFDPKPKLNELHGKPLPESLLKNVRFAFIKKESAVLMGSKRTFRKHGECGTEFSDLLPHIGSVADDILLVRGMHTDQFNHHPAQLLMQCGRAAFGLPTMGSWLTYGLGSESQNLPGYVVLTAGRGSSGGATLWQSGFLPSVHAGVRFRNQGDPVLNLGNPAGLPMELQRKGLDVLRTVNQSRYDQIGDPEIASRIASYELAFRMQKSAPELMDVSQETKATLDAYGVDRKPGKIKGGRGGSAAAYQTFARNFSCLGRCDSAPAVAVNDSHWADSSALTIDTVLNGNVSAGNTGQPAPPRRWECDPYEYVDERYGTVRGLISEGIDVGEKCVTELKASGLKGMGGAGFPTGRKWELVAGEAANPKYVICNADESEPGTFKDRVILSELPHLVVEGMLLAGLTVGAERGIVFLRHEYDIERRALETALREAREAGILGSNAAGSGRAFDIEIFVSPGGYILGEETALLEALEDRRGEPRNKPPYPGSHGLWGKPTLINNVESFAWATTIVHRGADWWNGEGVNGAQGRKFVSVSGDIASPGVYEIPLGTTVNELIAIAGGMAASSTSPEGTTQSRLLAFLPGGASSNFLPADKADTPLDFDAMKQAGSMLGTGAVIVIGSGRDLLPLAANLVRFFRNESCGKCVPCRVGSRQAVELLDGVIGGTRATGEIAILDELGETLEQTSICGLGQAREAARRSECKNNLKQIGIALHNYEETHKTLPPEAVWGFLVPGSTGRQAQPRHYTWIAMILPYMEQGPLYKQINFSQPIWAQTTSDGQLIRATLLKNLTCPSDESYVNNENRHRIGWTNYAGAEGWDWWSRSHDQHGGIFTLLVPTKFRDITDGLSNTIMVGEVTSHGFSGSRFPGKGVRRRGNSGVFRSALVACGVHPTIATYVRTDGYMPYPANLDHPDGNARTDWWGSYAAPYAYKPTYAIWGFRVPGSTGRQAQPRHFTWITLILPYMEQGPLYKQINFSQPIWAQTTSDGQLIRATLIKNLLCPSDESYVNNENRHRIGWTNYAGAEGWDWWSRSHDQHGGIFTLLVPTKFRDITDGLSNTIMVGEVTSHGFTGSRFPGQGRRRRGNSGVFRSALVACGVHPTIATYVRTDGYMPYPANLDHPDGNARTDWWGTYRSPYAYKPTYVDHYGMNSEWPGASSLHIGGAQFLMADGATRFISENIHFTTSSAGTQNLWHTLHTKAGDRYDMQGGDF
eukprot:g8443.t1